MSEWSNTTTKVKGVFNMKKQLLEAIEKDTLMDFISSYYNRFSKEELKTIIVELDMSSSRSKRVTKEMIKELEERL